MGVRGGQVAPGSGIFLDVFWLAQSMFTLHNIYLAPPGKMTVDARPGPRPLPRASDKWNS